MAMFILIAADGSTAAQIHTRGDLTPTAEGTNPDGLAEQAVDRFGAPDERFIDGAWVRYAPAVPAAVDAAHLADNGPLSIDMAHIQKAVEAQLIATGVSLPSGLVAAEAAALDMDIGDLAAAIVAKQAEANAIEVARRIAKTLA